MLIQALVLRLELQAIVVGLTLIVTACSGSDAPGPAVGADGERSGDASMGTVGFTDVAAEVGLDFRHSAFHWDAAADPEAMMSGGLCWIDYDRDGWLDLYLVNTWSESEW